MKETDGEERVKDVLERARRHSPFLNLQLERFPDIAAALEHGDLPLALELAGSCASGQADEAAALRRERSALALVLGVGDLAGCFALEEVTERLSGFADEAVERAISRAIRERTPEAEPTGFAAIALGKLGSRELNYSSDIDLIFLYDPETLPRKPREEPGQAALRIAQRTVEMLQKRDAEGYVFRVDLRLRPSPEVTPIALSVDAAISYYESSALPWERAAFIRARCTGGDKRLASYFLEAIHPFVWRRSLDFGAIGEIQSISRRIRDHFAQGQLFGPGYDLKRGRGGIREVEFFAQIHQLIHGGRKLELRAPATLDALRALSVAGIVGAEECAPLADAYRQLRTIEHRLQMVDDRQTHSLPSGEALDNVASLHGLEDGAALLALLEPTVANVESIYSRLEPEDGGRLTADPQMLEKRLAEAGFEEPAGARLRIEGWRSGKARSLRTAAAKEAFEGMLPILLEAFGAAPDSMRALNRFDDVVTRFPSGVNFYRLLEARPGLTQILATILCHAPALSEQLGRRPSLIEGLIDTSAFTPARSVEALTEDFATPERRGEDYQLLLDRIRRRVNEARFALGVQLITARSDPVEVAGGYARVAEAAIRVLADATIAEFEAQHGRVSGSELLILGLGRLGGEALTHASDLDLIYLFSGSHEGRSDGPRQLGATEYFNRLAQRISAALSVQTAAGPLYDVDTRLRPSGKDGLLAVSLSSFAEYQQERAWTWEHMALTRARPVYGSEEAKASMKSVVDGVLLKPRERGRLLADAAKMRAEMAVHKPPSGPYDIKLGDGGLVDLEFAVQVLQLSQHVGFKPQLEVAIADLVGKALIPLGIAEAHRLLTQMLVTFRLVSPNSAEPPPETRPLVARACGYEYWESLVEAHDDARHIILELWRDVAAGNIGD
jgi:[glutamine synthetase] adenylyltransferase / [glutamine synthetase]-adenylyl-L-tyrosine phosphorylase